MSPQQRRFEKRTRRKSPVPRLGQVIPSLITNNNSLTDVVDEVRLYSFTRSFSKISSSFLFFHYFFSYRARMFFSYFFRYVRSQYIICTLFLFHRYVLFFDKTHFYFINFYFRGTNLFATLLPHYEYRVLHRKGHITFLSVG